MDWKAWAKKQEEDGTAEVHTLAELQFAETGDGPWALYIYGRAGFHGCNSAAI